MTPGDKSGMGLWSDAVNKIGTTQKIKKARQFLTAGLLKYKLNLLFY